MHTLMHIYTFMHAYIHTWMHIYKYIYTNSKYIGRTKKNKEKTRGDGQDHPPRSRPSQRVGGRLEDGHGALGVPDR